MPAHIGVRQRLNLPFVMLRIKAKAAVASNANLNIAATGGLGTFYKAAKSTAAKRDRVLDSYASYRKYIGLYNPHHRGHGRTAPSGNPTTKVAARNGSAGNASAEQNEWDHYLAAGTAFDNLVEDVLAVGGRTVVAVTRKSKATQLKRLEVRTLAGEYVVIWSSHDGVPAWVEEEQYGFA